MTQLWENQAFTVSQADNAPLVGEGLRAFSEYRDPGIKHRELRHSDDMELIEIISPAEFSTFDQEAPE